MTGKRMTLTSLICLILILASPSLAFANSQDKGFKDLTEDSPHYEAIMALSEERIVSGYEDGTFRQWTHVTRGQAAVILYNTLNMRSLTHTSIEDVLDQYEDINPDSRYANEIAAVTYAGIFQGREGKFKPYEPLSRQQMATILVKAFKLSDKGIEDVDMYLGNVSDSHQENVQTIANLDITNRLDDYRPKEDTTRGALATMLYLVLDFLEKDSDSYQ